MLFIPALCSQCLARSCSLFSVSFVTALGPSKQEFSKHVAGAKAALGISVVPLGAAGTVTQLLCTLALGIHSTFWETEPGMWLQTGRGQSPDCLLGGQGSALSLRWTLLAQLHSLCVCFLLFSYSIYTTERGQRTVRSKNRLEQS